MTKIYNNSFRQKKNKVVSNPVLIPCTLLCLTFFQCAFKAMADSEGKYPGTGDYASWLQAKESSEDGVDYAQKGNYTMAIQCYDEAIQLFPGDALFHYNKATALKKLGRAKEAIAVFKKAVELEPKFGSAWYNMGNALQEEKNMAAAEDAYKQSAKINPKHMKSWFNLGENLYMQKKYSEARNAFGKANELPCSESDKKDIGNYLAELDRIEVKEQQD